MINSTDEKVIEFGVVWVETPQCVVCEILISDSGQFQCHMCRALHNARSTKQQLLSKYSDLESEIATEAAKSDWKRLMKVRTLYRKGRTDKLKRIYNVFKNKDGKTINARNYYELKN